MTSKPAVTSEELNALTSLIRRVNTDNPDPEDIEAFRRELRQRPHLWKVYGDLASMAARALMRGIKARPATVESLRIVWQAMAQEMGANIASPLERLLIQQVVLTWMRLYVVEMKYIDATNHGEDIRWLDYWERRLNAAQRRYLRACTALSRVQRMDLLPIQVNIAHQQVNQVNTH